MQTVVVRNKPRKVSVFTDINDIQVKNAFLNIEVYNKINSVTVKNRIPTITVYHDIVVSPPYTYIDGGLYNEEGIFIDGGLYNTTVWDTTISGGFA